MKKTLFTFITGFISLAAFSMCQYPYDSVQPIELIKSKSIKSSIRNLILLDNHVPRGNYVSDKRVVHERAIIDFKNRFRDAGDVLWFSYNYGFISYFAKGGYRDRAFYNKKGRWQYSLILYGEDKLPRDVRASVKSVYYDFTIRIVEEVQGIEGIAYIIYLEDKSNIRILRVSKEGEMETIQEFIKG